MLAVKVHILGFLGFLGSGFAAHLRCGLSQHDQASRSGESDVDFHRVSFLSFSYWSLLGSVLAGNDCESPQFPRFSSSGFG